MVWKMNRLGILPDVSHVSDDAVRHVLEVVPGPVIASHSSARACATTPGTSPTTSSRRSPGKAAIVMANTYPPFVAQGHPRRRPPHERDRPRFKETEEEYLKNPGKLWKEKTRLLDDRPLPAIPLSAFVDHVIRLIDLGGEEHVGIGTDFDGIPNLSKASKTLASSRT